MFDLSQATEFMDAIILPFVALSVLLLAKFRVGEPARCHERQFLAVLLGITIVTLRTVIYCEEFWLVHTLTLGSLIIAALVIPSQDASVAV